MEDLTEKLEAASLIRKGGFFPFFPLPLSFSLQDRIVWKDHISLRCWSFLAHFVGPSLFIYREIASFVSFFFFGIEVDARHQARDPFPFFRIARGYIESCGLFLLQGASGS